MLGPIDPSDLGPTLTHEQLLLDLTGLMKKPEYGPDCLSDLEFSIENLGKIRHFPYVHVTHRRSLAMAFREKFIEPEQSSFSPHGFQLDRNS